MWSSSYLYQLERCLSVCGAVPVVCTLCLLCEGVRRAVCHYQSETCGCNGNTWSITLCLWFIYLHCFCLFLYLFVLFKWCPILNMITFTDCIWIYIWLCAPVITIYPLSTAFENVACYYFTCICLHWGVQCVVCSKWVSGIARSLLEMYLYTSYII